MLEYSNNVFCDIYYSFERVRYSPIGDIAAHNQENPRFDIGISNWTLNNNYLAHDFYRLCHLEPSV